MRKALLVGFKYSHKEKLPGILVDLYLMYNFLKSNGWIDSEINILTDIRHDQQTDILRGAILEKIVHPDILHFIKYIKKNNIYIEYKSEKHYNNFLKSLPKSKNLFFYYTGHCKSDYFVLPNNVYVEFRFFLEKIKDYKRTILILDACELNLCLPYRYEKNLYRFVYDNFFQSYIICLSSSKEKEKSTAHIRGSIFTQNVINSLKDKYLSVKNLYKNNIYNDGCNDSNDSYENDKKEKKDKINISASYPILYLFSWLYSTTDLYISENSYSLDLIY